MRKLEAWPATEQTLALWISIRAFGSSDHRQEQVKPDTFQSYLAALRSHHVDRRMPTDAFKSPLVARMVRGVRNLFPSSRRERLPIGPDVLRAITPSPVFRDDINVNAAFKLAFAGFLRMGKFTHTKQRAADSQAFASANLIRSDVRLARNHATVRLKRSKIDRLFQGINVIVTATEEHNCPVLGLQLLFERDFQPPSAPLFSLQSGGFPRDKLIATFKQRLRLANIPATSYSGHSFRRGAAQHAKDHGLFNEQIQALGRWISDAFRRYFNMPAVELFRLNRTFQTGRPPPLKAATLLPTTPP